MSTFISNCRTNPFKASNIIHPLHKSHTIQEKVICMVTTIALGILTLGIAQLISCIVLYYQKNAGRFQKVMIENPNRKPGQPSHIEVHKRATAYWKDYASGNIKADFSYKKPTVKADFLGEHQPELKKEVEEKCLQEMRSAMRAMDQSMVDALNELLQAGELERPVATMNRFCERLMDLYEAYVEVQIDQGVPMLPAEIGSVKASGFTHQEILDLRKTCKWYVGIADRFIRKIQALGLSESDAHKLLNHIASQKYSLDTLKNTLHHAAEAPDEKKLPQELEKAISGVESTELIEQAAGKFLEKLEEKADWIHKIRRLDERFCFCKPFRQHEKEAFKRELAAFGDNDGSETLNKQSHSTDPKFRLIQEIEQRFRWRDFEPGHVGSPIRLINIARGNQDHQVKDFHFRTKLFFVYGSKNIGNEVAADPKLLKAVNEKLKSKGKKWQVDADLAEIQRGRSKEQPVYSLGVYSRENNIKGKSRHWATHEEIAEKQATDPNLTFAEYERIALRKSVSTEELDTRFRFKLSHAEEMSLFGTRSDIEEKAKESKKSIDMEGITAHPEELLCKTTTPDARFMESYIEHKKKEQCHWGPGKYYFTLHDESRYTSKYLEHIRELGFEQYSGISGSTDQTLTLGGLLGMQSREDLMDLRLMYLPWMVGNQDHSVTEILMAYKSFGIEYKPSVDYFRELYPDLTGPIVKALKKYQKERGYELPEYYLTEGYAKKVVAGIEKDQDEQVTHLMKTNRLVLHGCRTYRKNYSLDDPFGDAKWKHYTDFLSGERIDQINAKRAQKRAAEGTDPSKYSLNYHRRTFEPHKRTDLYKGSKKQSLTLVPPKGKVTPYVPFDYPHLNRVGLLFDLGKCQIKKNKHAYKHDANVDIDTPWKKHYEETERENATAFEARRKRDAEEAIEKMETVAHHVSWKELIAHNRKNQDQFIPYNEVNGSIHNDGIVGVFTFSRGLPKYTDRKVQYKDQSEKYTWEPLHHESVAEHTPDEDYDLYMLLMGIGKRIATREKFGVNVPLYMMNQTKDQGLTLVTEREQVAIVKGVLKNKNGELKQLARVLKHQSEVDDSSDKVQKSLRNKLEHYLTKLAA